MQQRARRDIAHIQPRLHGYRPLLKLAEPRRIRRQAAGEARISSSATHAICGKQRKITSRKMLADYNVMPPSRPPRERGR
jgi:hypothetical protein